MKLNQSRTSHTHKLYVSCSFLQHYICMCPPPKGIYICIISISTRVTDAFRRIIAELYRDRNAVSCIVMETVQWGLGQRVTLSHYVTTNGRTLCASLFGLPDLYCLLNFYPPQHLQGRLTSSWTSCVVYRPSGLGAHPCYRGLHLRVQRAH